MKRVAVIGLAAALASSTTLGGCMMRAAKEAYGVVTGPKGSFLVITEPRVPLNKYDNFVLGRITDPKDQIPTSFEDALSSAMRRELKAKKLPTNPKGKTMLVNLEILEYKSAGIIDEALGPKEEIVARISLVDKDTGKVIAVADCEKETSTTLTQGVGMKAGAVAKDIVNWIAENRGGQSDD